MRSVFGVLGLLVTLAIVGLIAKKQLAGMNTAVPALQMPAVESAPAIAGSASASVKEQTQQIQQQYKQAVDAAMQPPELPGDAK